MFPNVTFILAQRFQEQYISVYFSPTDVQVFQSLFFYVPDYEDSHYIIIQPPLSSVVSKNISNPALLKHPQYEQN
jgi:hypothetical protein